MSAALRPAVSVVIPAYRSPDRLRACLEALGRSDLDRDAFEVVVVDDGSPQPLAAEVADLEGTLQLRVHRQTNAGPAAARNTGARLAAGELLAFTDDDCRPAPAWLPALLDAHDGGKTLLGGEVVNELGENLYAEASQQLVSFLYEWYGGGRGAFFASNNLAVPRDRFLQVGAFDESFPRPGGEDRELCERWRETGGALRFVPDAVVHHQHTMGLAGFWRQHRNYGRGAYEVHRRRADRAGDGRMRVEPWRFYRDLVTYPLGRLPRGRAAGAMALLATSQAANALGFVEEAYAARRRHLRS